MSKSIKLKDNIYWDSNSITHKKEKLSDTLEKISNTFNDTEGTDIEDMLKNKLEYCKAKSNKSEMFFINGGYKKKNYGFGIFSNITNKAYHIIWFSTYGVYYCRELDGSYNYGMISWSSI